MKCIIVLVLLTGYINYAIASCTIGPNGINQWRLVEQIGNCLNADDCLVGTEIRQADCPYTISASGLYTVCENVTITDADPIILISVPDVTLNLNGHTIENNGTGNGIQCDTVQDVSIKNGSVGTATGIAVLVGDSNQIAVSDIEIIASGSNALSVSNSGAVLVQACSATTTSLVPVFLIGGTSDGVIFRSCTAFQAQTTGFSIQHTPATAYGVIMEDCHAIGAPGTIRGFDVVNANNSPVTFKNCSASSFVGGFSVDSRISPYFDSCYVRNVSGVASFGFRLISCDNALLQNCELSQASLVGYSFDACSNLTILNCRAKTTGGGAADGFVVLGDGTASKVVIENCSSIGFVNGFALGNFPSSELNSCVAERNSNIGFSSINSPNMVLRDCTAILGNFTGFYCANVSDVVAENCIAQNNGSEGFRLDTSASNITLSRCSSVGNNIGFSIAAGVTAFITLEQCLASGNTAEGINNANAVANTVFLMDTRSYEAGVGGYQLNGAADVPGSATTVTY